MLGVGAVPDRKTASPEEFGLRPEAAELDTLPQVPTIPPPPIHPSHRLHVTCPTAEAGTPHHRAAALSPFHTSFSQASALPGAHGPGGGRAKGVDSYDRSNKAGKSFFAYRGHQEEERRSSTRSYQGSEKDSIRSIFHHALPHHQTLTYTPNESSEELARPEDHVLWILVYLSTLCPLIALFICFYTAVITSFLIISTPFYLCCSQNTLAIRLRSALNPPLDFQLSFIYSEYTTTSNSGSINLVVVIHLLSPFYAIFIALSAWVAAAFWLYAGILGNPDGRGKDDGRETVLGVRRWWEKWLERGLR